MSRRQERDFANMYLIPEEEYNNNVGAREGTGDITFPYVQQLNFNEAEKVSVSQRNTDASARAPPHPPHPPPPSPPSPPPPPPPPLSHSVGIQTTIPQQRNMSTQSTNKGEMRGIQTDVPAQTIIPTQTDDRRTMERGAQTNMIRHTEIPTQTADRETKERTTQTSDREMKERATQMDEERQITAHGTTNVGMQIPTDSRLSDSIGAARLTLLNQLKKIRNAQAQYATAGTPSFGLSPTNSLPSSAPSEVIPPLNANPHVETIRTPQIRGIDPSFNIAPPSQDRSIIRTYGTSPSLPSSINSSIPPLQISSSSQTLPSLAVSIDRPTITSLRRRGRQAAARSSPLEPITPPTQAFDTIRHDRIQEPTPTPTLAETIASLGLGQYDDIIASSSGARKKSDRRPKRRPYYNVSREDRDMKPTTSRIVEIREGDSEADILAQLRAIKPLLGIPDDDVVMPEEKARPKREVYRHQIVRRRDRSRSPLRKNIASASNSGQKALEHVLDTVRTRSRNVVREIRALGEGKPISRSKSSTSVREARPDPSARRSSLDNTIMQLDDDLGTPTRYPKKRKKMDDKRKNK